MKNIHYLYTLLFGVAVVLFFGMAYPQHLHYQEHYQLFLFDSSYVGEVVNHPGGVADLLGRFCTQFFLFAWVGACIIGVLLSLVQLLMLRLVKWGRCYGLSYVPSFLLWFYLLDENSLMGSVWAVLLTLLVVWGLVRFSRTTSGLPMKICLIMVAVPILYWIAGPVGFPVPVKNWWTAAHYYRYPTVFPTLLYIAAVSVYVLPLLVRFFPGHVIGAHDKQNGSEDSGPSAAKASQQSLTEGHQRVIKVPALIVWQLCTFAVVAVVMGYLVRSNSNFKAEKVMQYDFMATHQQWNRILETVNAEKPNNQMGVTVQNLALAMHGMLISHGSEYHQNGIAGLLPDVQSDATSPMPTAEAFYQLGMINVAQRTVFEAQEAILDFQKSGRCYKRLAQTNLINGNYEVARKYLTALQKTLFYRDWANETLPLLGDEKAIAMHPEYGKLRKMAYKDEFYFSDHTTPEMLENLLRANPSNQLAFQYLVAYHLLTGDVQRAEETFKTYSAASDRQ